MYSARSSRATTRAETIRLSARIRLARHQCDAAVAIGERGVDQREAVVEPGGFDIRGNARSFVFLVHPQEAIHFGVNVLGGAELESEVIGTFDVIWEFFPLPAREVSLSTRLPRVSMVIVAAADAQSRRGAVL